MYQLKRTINRLSFSYRHDDRGVSAIEAALILPLAILLFIGLFETGQALLSNQKVYAASHMAADLLSRKAILNEDDLDDSFFAAQLIVQPFPTDTLRMCMMGARFNDDTDVERVWQQGFPDNNACVNDLMPFAEGLGAPGEGVIVVEARYPYRPTFIGVRDELFSAFDMREVSVLRGRINACVGLNNGGNLFNC